jgi:prepilin signal peptidase PulO-like enzyme (type II secretory pathway)
VSGCDIFGRMIYFIVASHFLFGTIIGSFLNVLILRYNTGRSLSGRSSCLNCKHKLSWYELVPVLSWLIQGGRCRSCGARVSAQYPIVEFICGIIFAAVSVLELQVAQHAMVLVIASLLVAIAVYDLKHTIIPNIWVYAFSIISLAFFILTIRGEITIEIIIYRILSGVSIAAPFAFLWFISKGRWMGLGDAKLMLGIGILLGFAQGVFSVMMSFVFGAVFGLILILLSSDKFRRIFVRFTPTPISNILAWGFTMKSEIPFGPFLIGVSIIVWFLNLQGINLNLEILTQAFL